MHVDAADREAGERSGAGVDLAGARDRHAELVLRLAGRDLGVGARVDVGIDANGDQSGRAAGRREGRQRLELGLGLDIEAEDLFVEAQRHFRLGLAHAGKDDPVPRDAGGARPPQLPLAHHVHAGAEPGQSRDHRLIGIGLHRVKDERVLAGEGGAEHLEMALDGRARIAIERGADRLGDRRQGDVLGAKHAAAIGKVMHRGVISAADRE